MKKGSCRSGVPIKTRCEKYIRCKCSMFGGVMQGAVWLSFAGVCVVVCGAGCVCGSGVGDVCGVFGGDWV